MDQHFMREQFGINPDGGLEHRGFGAVFSGDSHTSCYTYDVHGEACSNALSEHGTIWQSAKGKTSNKFSSNNRQFFISILLFLHI